MLADLRPEEGQSIWSKCRKGFQPCFEAGIRELPFLMPEPAEKPSHQYGTSKISLGYPAGSVDTPGKIDAKHPVLICLHSRWFASCHGRGYFVQIEIVQV